MEPTIAWIVVWAEMEDVVMPGENAEVRLRVGEVREVVGDEVLSSSSRSSVPSSVLKRELALALALAELAESSDVSNAVAEEVVCANVKAAKAAKKMSALNIALSWCSLAHEKVRWSALRIVSPLLKYCICALCCLMCDRSLLRR